MRSGIEQAGMDTSVRPQDDLFGYVNGTWVRETEVPADRSRFGTFDILRDQAQEHVRALLEEAGDAAGGVRPGPDADPIEALRAQVGSLYSSFMATERVESLGLSPVEEDLAAVDAVASTEDLWRLLGRLLAEGVGGAVAAYVNTDKRASDRYALYLFQAGLGLPDEAYYREEASAPIREAYVAHLERLLALAGSSDPSAEAAQVMDLETRLASFHWDRVSNRDAVATYTKVTREELERLAPNVPWGAWLEGLGAGPEALDGAIVSQPSFLEGLSRLVEEAPLAQWRAWLRRHVLGEYASLLPEAFVDEHFDFYGRTLTGATQLRDRWRRGVALVESLMGEAAGRLYVQRHFAASSKERMVQLVENLIEAYRQDISELDWMGPDTRLKALAKLETFTPKIAYPDEWRDYSGLVVEPDDLVGNVRRGNEFETRRELGKLGGPVDRGEWFMSPQTVNAYYNPGMNEIVFPAAILQPPFFDPEADDAVNYGAIGSVIGHEIGHGFDDQGSRYDGDGNLADWWTQEDRERFDERARALIDQYAGFSPRELPDEHVNGELTVGENIGDLGGVTIAHLAYRISLEGAEAPVLDGLTGEQRFFCGWAQAWRGKARPEEARRLLALDPHSPMEFRANIVRNLTEFYEAFDVAPGDGLHLPEEERVRIW